MTVVPLRLPRSSMTISGESRMVACRRETESSTMTTSQSLARPSVSSGFSSRTVLVNPPCVLTRAESGPSGAG